MEKKQINLKNLILGDGNIYIQSMTNTKTCDVKSTIKQIKELESHGCDIVRVAVLNEEDALAIKEIKKSISIPIVADIHFDYKLAILSIESGADKIRINPGNIGSLENLEAVVNKAKEFNIPIRVGVNSGSIDKDSLDKFGNNFRALAESVLKSVGLIERFGYKNIVVSAKSTNIEDTIKANEIIYASCPYPIHIGLTETGPVEEGKIKSTICLSKLLSNKIGDTIRVSLTDNPVEEVDFAKSLLKVLNIKNGINIISCPTCGRCDINLIDLVNKVNEFTKDINKDLTIAIMGCVVNGPGEAKHCDFGIAGGKDYSILFKNGEVLKKIENTNLFNEIKLQIEEYK